MWFERRFIYEYIFFYFPPFERQALVFEVTQLQRLKLCVGGCTCRKKKGGGSGLCEIYRAYNHGVWKKMSYYTWKRNPGYAHETKSYKYIYNVSFIRVALHVPTKEASYYLAVLSGLWVWAAM